MDNSSYRVTNRGIEFDAIRLVGSPRHPLAVFNCHFENNLGGPIGLSLFARDSYQKWREESRAPSGRGHQYYVTRTRLGTYEEGRWDRDFEDVFRRQVILIGDSDGTMLAQQKMSIYAIPKVWMEAREMAGEGIELIPASPANAWNLTTGVMCPALSYEQLESRKYRAEGTFVVRFKASGVTISATISYEVDFRKSYHLPLSLHLALAHPESMEEHPQDRDSRWSAGHFHYAETKDPQGGLYSATARFKIIMGDPVLVVEMSSPSTRSTTATESD